MWVVLVTAVMVGVRAHPRADDLHLVHVGRALAVGMFAPERAFTKRFKTDSKIYLNGNDFYDFCAVRCGGEFIPYLMLKLSGKSTNAHTHTLAHRVHTLSGKSIRLGCALRGVSQACDM